MYIKPLSAYTTGQLNVAATCKFKNNALVFVAAVCRSIWGEHAEVRDTETLSIKRIGHDGGKLPLKFAVNSRSAFHGTSVRALYNNYQFSE